jgi:hypothetical protein
MWHLNRKVAAQLVLFIGLAVTIATTLSRLEPPKNVPRRSSSGHNLRDASTNG